MYTVYTYIDTYINAYMFIMIINQKTRFLPFKYPNVYSKKNHD